MRKIGQVLQDLMMSQESKSITPKITTIYNQAISNSLPLLQYIKSLLS